MHLRVSFLCSANSSTAAEAASTDAGRAADNWPLIYELPTFPATLQLSLERKDPSFKNMGKSPERASLIQVLFDNITTYTW